METNWKLVSDRPPIGEDVLIYSSIAKGFAVAQLQFNRTWVNSTNGLPFAPNSVTHWMHLPEAPSLTGLSGFQSYSSGNN